MKSRTSCFNAAVFRKDLTRFAPAWGLYIVGLILCLVLTMESGINYWFIHNIASSISFMGMVNFAYGLLTALLLFGDLFQSRLCNPLHALPLRRECWFCTHTAAGLAFSLIPTTLVTIPALVLTFLYQLENGWQVVLLWLLANNLQFLFFFGVATLCVFLTGNRMGAALIYSLIQFGAILVYYLAEIIYVPHLTGVLIQLEPFLVFSPVLQILQTTFVETQQIQQFLSYAPDGSENYALHSLFSVTGSWWYLWVYAAIGLGLLVVSLMLYRRRKLECAGDLMSTRKLEIPFLALFSLAAAGVFQLTYVAFIGYAAYGSSSFLWIGLAVGWFTGLMLLRRTSQVFGKKSFLGFLLMALALGLSLVVNSMDPLGLTTKVPQPQDVKEVKLQLSFMHTITLDTPEEIQDVIHLHTLATEELLDAQMGAVNRPIETEQGKATYVQIDYTLQNGSILSREYAIVVDSEGGEILRHYFSTLDGVLDTTYYYYMDGPEHHTADSLRAILDDIDGVYIQGLALNEASATPEQYEALLEAIIADSEAGNLVQHMAFHDTPMTLIERANGVYEDAYTLYLSIDYGKDHLYIDVYADCANIMAWLEQTGMLEPALEALRSYY